MLKNILEKNHIVVKDNGLKATNEKNERLFTYERPTLKKGVKNTPPFFYHTFKT